MGTFNNPPQSASPWLALEIAIPGKDILKQVREVLETLVIFLDIAKTLLEVVKTFLQAIGNPLKALILAIIALVENFLESLRRSGFYMWYHFPDFSTDPWMKRLAGGYPAFVERWKGSLLDTRDPNRPRPIPGFNSGGFILILADVQGPAKLIRLIMILIKFFGSSLISPQYGAPANAKVLPIGADGDTPLKIAQWFNSEFTGLVVEWELPGNTATPTDGFNGLAADIRTQFVPPNFLVEKTAIYPSEQIVDDGGSWFDEGAGQLYKLVESENAKNPRTGKAIQQKIRVIDEFGQPVVLMEEAYPITASTDVAQTILSILGYSKFRWIDEEAEVDKQYWYRVRAYSGELDYNKNKKKINFTKKSIVQDPNKKDTWYLEYPGTDGGKVAMGKATALIPGRIPKTLPDFDVYENLRRIFLAAFSFNFQAPPVQGVPVLVKDPILGPVNKLDSSGYPIYEPVYNPDGTPISPPYSNIIIGEGSLNAQAGALASFSATPLISILTNKVTQGEVAEPPQDITPEAAPWINPLVRLSAARLANLYGGLLLEGGAEMLEGFRTLMQGPLPFSPFELSELGEGESTLRDVSTLEEMVFALTKIDEPENKGVTTTGLFAGAASVVAGDDLISAIRQGFEWRTDLETVRTYGTAFTDIVVRKNLLTAVNYLKALGYQGQPPDWVRFSLLQDLLPWSSQILYDILAKIQALVDAFNGLLDEIIQYIDMIIRKIETLEAFIEFIIMILNFIEQLSAGFYLLFASGLKEGIGSWFSVIDNAGGDVPKSTADGGYTAGLCLAYLAPNIAPVEAALELIF